MDLHKSRVAVGAVGLLYGCVGFSLSVVATLITILIPVMARGFRGTPRVFLPSGGRWRGQAVSFNKLSESTTSSPSTSKAGQHNNTYATFDDTLGPRTGSSSPPQPQQVDHDGNIMPHLKTTIITLPPIDLQPVHNRAFGSLTSRPPRISTSEAYLGMSEDSRPAFRLANLKPPWGEKRPRIYRCVSSPHLTTSAPPFPPPHEEKVLPVVRKKPKSLRKAPSTPNCSGSLLDKGSSRIVVKKRSQPLRTQPYEAPYFCPTPIPKQDIPRRDRPTRTRTSRRSPPPVPPPVPSIPQTLR